MRRRLSRYVPERGDIAWVDFTPYLGHEQRGRRPAFVLTPREYNARGLLLACAISSKVKGRRFEVPLPERLRTNGVIIADQLRSFDWRARQIEFRERASQDVLDEVLARIAALLDL